jgi:hypothetical protein
VLFLLSQKWQTGIPLILKAKIRLFIMLKMGSFMMLRIILFPYLEVFLLHYYCCYYSYYEFRRFLPTCLTSPATSTTIRGLPASIECRLRHDMG